MSEQYDFNGNSSHSWFNHLLLQSEVSELTKRDDLTEGS